MPTPFQITRKMWLTNPVVTKGFVVAKIFSCTSNTCVSWGHFELEHLWRVKSLTLTVFESVKMLSSLRNCARRFLVVGHFSRTFKFLELCKTLSSFLSRSTQLYIRILQAISLVFKYKYIVRHSKSTNNGFLQQGSESTSAEPHKREGYKLDCFLFARTITATLS